MIVLLLGPSGQLGSALQATKPHNVEIITRGRSEIDLVNTSAVEALVSEISADLIINAAAYTAVDKAEEEEELAVRINVDGVAAIASAAEKRGARLMHISTDYVFDGMKASPYQPDDAPAPLGVYGRTKLEGEKEALRRCQNSLIIRTAWLYSEQGGNFVKTMLRLMAAYPQVRVVTDQIGTPTYARSLAQALWALADIDRRGILHYTDSGVASWYDFACAIQEEAIGLGLLKNAVPILPISTAEYPTQAKRPFFSILDKSETWALLGHPANHWRSNLRVMLEGMMHA
jgi:dTDP-4-dehydrorhamnose reductase